jgi:hypothetical protein
MSDELDDLIERRPAPGAAGAGKQTRRGNTTARLIGRLYTASDRSVRPQLLSCLLRPLSPLGRVAVAAGAFAMFVTTDSLDTMLARMDEATRFSSEQIAELARFVQQVSPQALDRFAQLATDNRIGMTAFGLAAAALLLRTLSRSRAAPFVATL